MCLLMNRARWPGQTYLILWTVSFVWILVIRLCEGNPPVSDVDLSLTRHICHLRVDDFQMHDDVIKWKHFPRCWPFVRGIHRSPGKTPHKGQWRWSLMLSLICVWINGWVNNREAGDLSRYRAHYDVTVMDLRWLGSGHQATCPNEKVWTFRSPLEKMSMKLSTLRLPNSIRDFFSNRNEGNQQENGHG